MPAVTRDVTPLSPDEERAFWAWAQANGIRDVDHPDSHYDYRGFWKQTQGAAHPPGAELHFPDTFKQHGHPTFSQESQYSRGPWDGGLWQGETFLPQPALAVNHPASALSLRQFLEFLRAGGQ